MTTAAQTRLAEMSHVFGGIIATTKQKATINGNKPQLVSYVVTPPRTIPQGRAGIAGQLYRGRPNNGIETGGTKNGGNAKKMRHWSNQAGKGLVGR